jgi:5-methyltetrahydropteroyltriglutamate--homocysteine methyltransferase
VVPVREPRSPARAEVVGSLLRPAVLQATIEGFYATGHTAVLAEERSKDRTELRALEDRVIRDAVRRQIDIGLDVVSDGEFRRWMFQNSFWDGVSGVSTDKVVRFRNQEGRELELNVPVIDQRLERVESPAAREAAFLVEVTKGHPFKVTFPAASLFAHPLTTIAGTDAGGYEDLDAFVAHAIEIEQRLVADAIEAGARYVQFDFPLYPYLVDPTWIARFEGAGHDVGQVLERSLAADVAVLHGVPEGVTTALHICRGNYRSSWMCEGSLEPVAERVFGELPYDAFLVEWDDLSRDGGFGPVRFLRSASTMVMGLVSSKTPVLEDESDLLRKMEEAASLVGGMDRLAISSQCGFASVMVGNETNEDVQWRKLELVARIADRLFD